MKNFFFTCVLLFCSVIIALLIGEFGLRVYGITPNPEKFTPYEFDRILGWRIKKSFKYFKSSVHFSHFNYSNLDGFPSNSENFKKSLSTTTPSIVFIGDSFTESAAVPYESSFPYLVGKRFPNKQIINLGVSGYAPDQYLLSARERLNMYNVKNIIVMFFPYNDVTDIFQKTQQGFYPKPYFEDNNFGAPINVPLKEVRSDDHEERNTVKNFFRNTAIYQVLRPIRDKINIPFTSIGSPKIIPRIYKKNQMEKALSLIHEIKVENPGATFFVYYIAQYEEYITPDTYKKNIALYRDTCKDLKLQCITMDSILDQQSDPSKLYIIDDGHFSEFGASLVVNQIFELLQSK